MQIQQILSTHTLFSHAITSIILVAQRLKQLRVIGALDFVSDTIISDFFTRFGEKFVINLFHKCFTKNEFHDAWEKYHRRICGFTQ